MDPLNIQRAMRDTIIYHTRQGLFNPGYYRNFSTCPKCSSTYGSFSTKSNGGPPYARYNRIFIIYQEDCDISDSYPGISESFPSTPETLKISFTGKSTIGPSVSEKENFRPSVYLEKSPGPSPPDQGFLRPTLPASGTCSFCPSTKVFQDISSNVKGDSPYQQSYTGNTLHSQEDLGLSISA